MTLRTRGRVQTVAEFNDIVVREKNGHPIRNSEDLSEAMRNIKNRNSSPLQFINDFEQTSHFSGIQRRRRFIHRHDSKLHRERLGNLDQLPVTDA